MNLKIKMEDKKSKTKWWIFFLLILWFKVESIATFNQPSFSFDDLKNITGSCANRGECRTNIRGFRLDTPIDWSRSNCFCDVDCSKYGDCCLGAKTYSPESAKSAKENFDCVDIFPFDSFYMKRSCDIKAKRDKIYELCNKANPNFFYSYSSQDPFLDTPVTSVLSYNSYPNYYCALCNFEPVDKIVVWPSRLLCQNINSMDPNEVLKEENLKFINDTWSLVLPDKNISKCEVHPYPADIVTNGIRKCKRYIDTCSSIWTDSEVSNLCSSYTTVVYASINLEIFSEDDAKRIRSYGHPNDDDSKSYAFRNYHCALCNYIPEEDIGCYTRGFRKFIPLFPSSFSVLFDFTQKTSGCLSGEVRDPFTKECRKILCTDDSSDDYNGDCLVIPGQEETSTNHSSKFNNCEKVYYNETEYYIGENNTLLVYSSRKIYKEEDYKYYDNGVIVCAPPSYSSLMAWMTLIGLGISCICLIIHLIVFMMVPDLKNLSGKNLASFSFALLVAYFCFLSSTFIHSNGNCFVLAPIMYYAFLASFTWMNVMAFDIWKTLQQATNELRVVLGKQKKKFILYSMYAWILPLIFTIIVLCLDYIDLLVIPTDFQPKLGEKYCWLGSKKSILIYFVSPISVIMLMNLIFFGLAVFIVSKTTRSTASMTTSCHPHQIQLKLYMRIALLMGLSWISGIIGGYLQNDYLWYLFILLNTFQGLFIFMSFTCSKKVRKSLLENQSKWYKFSCKSDNQSSSLNGKKGLESHDSHNSSTLATNLSSSSAKNLMTSP